MNVYHEGFYNFYNHQFPSCFVLIRTDSYCLLIRVPNFPPALPFYNASIAPELMKALWAALVTSGTGNWPTNPNIFVYHIYIYHIQYHIQCIKIKNQDEPCFVDISRELRQSKTVPCPKDIQGQKDHLGLLPGKSGKEKRNQTWF